MLNQKKPNQYLNGLIELSNSMHNIVGFDFSKLRRKIRPFCKTTSFENELFSIQLKDSKKAIMFTAVENEFHSQLTTIHIKHVTNFDSVADIHLNVISNKELIQKLLKHGLFN